MIPPGIRWDEDFPAANSSAHKVDVVL